MSEARQKLIDLALEKYPGTTQAHAEKVADQILKEEREKIRKEVQDDGGRSIKQKIKRRAGIK